MDTRVRPTGNNGISFLTTCDKLSHYHLAPLNLSDVLNICMHIPIHYETLKVSFTILACQRLIGCRFCVAAVFKR